MTGYLCPAPTDNLPIPAGIPTCWASWQRSHTVDRSLDISSNQSSPVHRVEMHLKSNVSTPACLNVVWPLLGLVCGTKETDCRPCCPPMSNPSNSPWAAWPYGCGWWDKRMAAQHLPRELCGLAVDWKSWLIQWRKIVRSRSVHTATSSIIWVETAAPLSQVICQMHPRYEGFA